MAEASGERSFSKPGPIVSKNLEEGVGNGGDLWSTCGGGAAAPPAGGPLLAPSYWLPLLVAPTGGPGPAGAPY